MARVPTMAEEDAKRPVPMERVPKVRFAADSLLEGVWIRTIGTPPNFFGHPAIPRKFTFRNITPSGVAHASLAQTLPFSAADRRRHSARRRRRRRARVRR